MTDLVRVFLIVVCMWLSFTLGRKMEREMTTKKVFEQLGSVLTEASKKLNEMVNQVEKEENFDAPAPNIFDKKD